MKNASFTALACRSFAFMVERDVNLFDVWEDGGEHVERALRHVYGSRVMSPREVITKDETALLLYLAGDVIEG
jgi:hypothetical protein